jgi:large subunit ribosomal protein L25
VRLPEGTELKADAELLVVNVVASPTESQLEGESAEADEAPAAADSAASES